MCQIVFIVMNALAGLIVSCLAFNAYGLLSSQIAGGKDALDGLYPYQASLRDLLNGNTYFCSGAIISEHYVITTAQCLTGRNKNPFNINVAVGSNYLDKPYALYKAADVIIHAGYNKLSNLNNIGLIYIPETINRSENVQPITLPNADRNYEDYPLLITGWGRLWSGGPIPNHLQEIIVKGCPEKTYSRNFNDIKKLCTYTTQGEGICHGDAGSPVVADGVLVGLVSHNYASCGSGLPDLSTRVFYYKTWIDSHTKRS
ncbi:Chymotrypsin-2 [Formica fusca]